MDRGEQGFPFFHFPHFLISAREVREGENVGQLVQLLLGLEAATCEGPSFPNF